MFPLFKAKVLSLGAAPGMHSTARHLVKKGEAFFAVTNQLMHYRLVHHQVLNKFCYFFRSLFKR